MLKKLPKSLILQFRFDDFFFSSNCNGFFKYQKHATLGRFCVIFQTLCLYNTIFE